MKTNRLGQTRCDCMRGLTKNADVMHAINNGLDVITPLQTEILNDTENNSYQLLSLYEDADEHERALMDTVLVCICGWGMKSIIEMAKPMES